MDENLKIRPFSLTDKAKLIEILKLNVPQYFAENEVDDFIFYLDYEIEKYFVAEFKEQIVGAGGINFEDDYRIGKISWDLISPKFQGLGIGAQLLKYRIDLLKSMKVSEITVRTSQLVYQFYEKNGFYLIETHKDYWAKGFDLYKMIYDDK